MFFSMGLQRVLDSNCAECRQMVKKFDNICLKKPEQDLEQ